MVWRGVAAWLSLAAATAAAWFFSLIFHMGFRLRVVFACIFTFPIDSMLTEFSKQHITWRVKVIRKPLGFVFCGKRWISVFLLALLTPPVRFRDIPRSTICSVFIGQFRDSVISELKGLKALMTLFQVYHATHESSPPYLLCHYNLIYVYWFLMCTISCSVYSILPVLTVTLRI